MAASSKTPPERLGTQRSRFEQAAREAGCDETGEAFEHAFGKIVPPKLPEKQDEQPKKKPGR